MRKNLSRRGFIKMGAAGATIAALGGLANSAAGCAPTNSFPGPRFYPGLGLRGGKVWESDPTYIQTLYTQYALPRESRYFLTTPRYWFIGEKKLMWKDFLVDETLAPASHNQARNPNWSNYKWNQKDILTEMLQAQVVKDNKAKLNIFVATTATSEHHPVPQWVIDQGLTWIDTKKERTHVRQDLEEGWRVMADFLVALVKRYGKSRQIASIVLGEYYPSPEGRPADLNISAFRANAKKIWADVIKNAPRDNAGTRINIAQSNPILAGGDVTASDIANLKLAISDSDPFIFGDGCGDPSDVICDPGTLDRARQDLYGKVPIMHQCGASIIRQGYEFTWTGIANPFGYQAGQTLPIQLEQVAWYFSSMGVIPTNSVTMAEDPVLTDHWFSVFDRFGPNGTAVTSWGQIPNYPAKRSPDR